MSIVLVASNTSNHDDNADNNDADDNNAAKKKTLVSAVAGGLVSLVRIALSGAFIYRRHCHHGSKDNNGDRGNNLAKQCLCQCSFKTILRTFATMVGMSTATSMTDYATVLLAAAPSAATLVAKMHPAPPSSRRPHMRGGGGSISCPLLMQAEEALMTAPWH